MDQDSRESGRGSISYTDYYSSEDGTIRKAPKHDDDLPVDPIEEDEDHTLTLRQNEEQKKQDLQSIFSQKESATKAISSSYKKIGRLAENLFINNRQY